MRLVKLTESTIKELFTSVATSDVVGNLMQHVVKELAVTYSYFVHTTLLLNSGTYVKISSHDSPVSDVDRFRIMNQLKMLAEDVTEDNVLVADKMDILYGTDYRTYCEHSKFKLMFYETVFASVTNALGPELVSNAHEDFFNETVRGIEFVISMIEQLVVYSSSEVDLEDTVILCLVHRPDAVFFIVM